MGFETPAAQIVEGVGSNVTVAEAAGSMVSVTNGVAEEEALVLVGVRDAVGRVGGVVEGSAAVGVGMGRSFTAPQPEIRMRESRQIRKPRIRGIGQECISNPQ